MAEPDNTSSGADDDRESGPSPSGARLVAHLARLLLRIFFRRIEYLGGENLPKGRPLVFVANHINALVDPALLIAFLPVTPRFLAKSTLWSNPVVRPFLQLAAAIPVYRRQDPHTDPRRNVETFSRCHRVLAAGGAIAIFPEGRSHSQPALVPLKTGVSRIVLEAEAKYGPLGTMIVPVGLTFDDKGRFRSRVLLKVGQPLDPAPESAAYERDSVNTVQTLTDRVKQALADVTLNYPSWEEARLIERAADLFQRPTVELPLRPALAERFEIRKVFTAGYGILKDRYPQRVAEVADLVRRYDDLLQLAGLRDEQVASSYPRRGIALFVAKSLWRLAIRLPLAAVGTILNWPAYRATGWVADRWGRTPDLLATYKLMSSLVFFPLVWLTAAGLVAALIGAWPALLVTVVAPVSAAVALRFHERRELFGSEARAYLLLRRSTGPIEILRQARNRVLEAVRDLVDLYSLETNGEG